jgi:hypothetical protein
MGQAGGQIGDCTGARPSLARDDNHGSADNDDSGYNNKPVLI